MKPWALKRTRQCEKCPWRVETNPHDIPNGYTDERHRQLRSCTNANKIRLRGPQHQTFEDTLP